MSEVVSWLVEQFWGIVLGVITALIVTFIVTFLPLKEDVRYKAIFYRRKLAKLIFNPAIKVCYTIKTGSIEDKNMRLSELVRDIREKLVQSNFKFKSEYGNASIFEFILGNTEVEIVITPSYIVDEEEEPLVDYLQCDFKLTECKYRNFNGHLLDLIQVFRMLEVSLENITGKWTGESLTCEIKRLYEFVGVLKDLKMSSLTGTIGGKYTIELFENKLLVYGTIETKMTSIIKDIITYYF
jgi:hypothetical protein